MGAGTTRRPGRPGGPVEAVKGVVYNLAGATGVQRRGWGCATAIALLAGVQAASVANISAGMECRAGCLLPLTYAVALGDNASHSGLAKIGTCTHVRAASSMWLCGSGYTTTVPSKTEAEMVSGRFAADCVGGSSVCFLS